MARLDLKGRMDQVTQAPLRDANTSVAMWQAVKQDQRETQGDAQGLLQGSSPGNIRVPRMHRRS